MSARLTTVQAMTIPEQYRPALDALVAGLLVDLHWRTYLDRNGETPADLAISAVLTLTGPVRPVYVQPWSSDETRAVGAHVFTDAMLVTVTAPAPGSDAGTPAASAVPLQVESLGVRASVSPWASDLDRTPPWPGSLTATVRVAGIDEPIVVPSRPIRDADHRAAVQTLVEHLAARLRPGARPAGQVGAT
jgi:hypothetical protein